MTTYVPLDKLAKIADRLTSCLRPQQDFAKQCNEALGPDVCSALARMLTENKKLGWAIAFVATELTEILRELVNADVAFCRVPRRGHEFELLVGSDAWNSDIIRVGTVPTIKDINHGPCTESETSGGNRDGQHNEDARLSQRYSSEEMRFLDWLKSEAWIPVRVGSSTRALFVFGKGQRDFFTVDKINELRRYEDFVCAFFHLAELTEDRFRKGELLKEIVRVLPTLIQAPTMSGFWRGIVTLFTSAHGFGFDRAFLFWLDGRQCPAECKVAVGGLGNPDNGPNMNWRSVQAGTAMNFKELIDQVNFAISTETVFVNDPLYQSNTDLAICLQESDADWIAKLIEGHSQSNDDVEKLTASDPWIAKIRAQRPGIFCSPHDEYFVFPIVPLGVKNGPGVGPMGFVIADLPYRESPHMPAVDFPDLHLAKFVLHLISALWQMREDAQSYLHVLNVLPILHDEGKNLGLDVGTMQSKVAGLAEMASKLVSATEKVVDTTKKIEEAAHYVDEMRAPNWSDPIDDLQAVVRQAFEDAERRFGVVIGDWSRVEPVAIGMPRNTLVAILDCLIHNAVEAAQRSNTNSLSVCAESVLIEVPEGRSNANRVSLRITNDGPPIDPAIQHYLFVSRVSTRPEGRRGLGLSNAHRQARAYGGDLFLRSSNPVTFELVLETCNNP